MTTLPKQHIYECKDGVLFICSQQPSLLMCHVQYVGICKAACKQEVTAPAGFRGQLEIKLFLFDDTLLFKHSNYKSYSFLMFALETLFFILYTTNDMETIIREGQHKL